MLNLEEILKNRFANWLQTVQVVSTWTQDRCQMYLDNVHVEGLVHESSLEKDQQVKVPGPAEISDYNGMDWHRRKELSPGRRGETRRLHLLLAIAQRILDVLELAG